MVTDAIATSRGSSRRTEGPEPDERGRPSEAPEGVGEAGADEGELHPRKDSTIPPLGIGRERHSEH